MHYSLTIPTDSHSVSILQTIASISRSQAASSKSICNLPDHLSQSAPILAHGLHASFLANGCDLGVVDLIRAPDVVLQVNLLAKIHLRSARLEATHRFP